MVAIHLVAPCMIKFIHELMEDIIETLVLSPIVLVEATIDVVNNSVVNQTYLITPTALSL